MCPYRTAAAGRPPFVLFMYWMAINVVCVANSDAVTIYKDLANFVLIATTTFTYFHFANIWQNLAAMSQYCITANVAKEEQNRVRVL